MTEFEKLDEDDKLNFIFINARDELNRQLETALVEHNKEIGVELIAMIIWLNKKLGDI